MGAYPTTDRGLVNIYLAASYARLEEIEAYAEKLRRLGHTVTSRWHEGHSTPLSGSVEEMRGTATIYARMDIDDVVACNLFIAFTSTPMTSEVGERPVVLTHENGGTHVEYGIAIARAKELWVVGPQEHIFHLMNRVRVFGSWTEALKGVEAS